MAQGNNPNNSESKLYRQLTKLFSGPIVNYRRQTYHKLRRRQLDKYKFTSAQGQAFKKLDSSPFSQIMTNVMQNHNRAQRYADFDQMEYDPYIAAALDMYADDVTTSNPLTQMMRIECSNDEIKSVLESLYIDVLNVESNLFQWVRTTVKYGDYFIYLDIDDRMGITNTIGLPSSEVERLEGQDPTNPTYVQFQWNSGGLTFENWQVGHFRLLGDDKYVPYGQSILDSARRIWRQVQLVEDAMMAYRLVRAPERRVFYIDVGSISAQDVDQYMQKIITSMKRGSIVNEQTGRIDLRYNPMHVEEDYFLPVRGDTSKTKIEPLPGGQFVGDIDDVKYLRDKLFAALKIPTSYLIRSEDGGEDKTTLAQKDIQFSRTIQRVQRAIVEELEKIGIVHLFSLGYRGKDLIDFKLFLNNPSKIAELQDLEHWRTKFDVAAAAIDGFMSRRWISEKLFAQSHEEFLRNQREMYYDRYVDSNLEAAQESARVGAGDFFGEEELDAEFGDEMDPESIDLEAGGADELEGGEGDSALLAAPAKRDDEYTKPGWKGKKYKRVSDDKRDMGARKSNYNGQWAKQMAGSSTRNIFKGMGELGTLSKGLMEGNPDEVFEKIYPERPDVDLSGRQAEILETLEGVDDLLNEINEAVKNKEQLNG